MERFRKAVESGDADAIVGTLAENVVLKSPILFRPIEGKAAVSAILRAVVRVFRDFRYLAELHEVDASGHATAKTALEFVANVGDKQIHGIDLGVVDADGNVVELAVFVRPYGATNVFMKAMQVELGLAPADA